MLHLRGADVRWSDTIRVWEPCMTPTRNLWPALCQLTKLQCVIGTALPMPTHVSTVSRRTWLATTHSHTNDKLRPSTLSRLPYAAWRLIPPLPHQPPHPCFVGLSVSHIHLKPKTALKELAINQRKRSTEFSLQQCVRLHILVNLAPLRRTQFDFSTASAHSV